MKDFDFFGIGTAFGRPYDPKDKEQTIRHYVQYMLIRTQSMFDYTGLPDTMPRQTLELYTQVNGFCGIVEHDGDLYSLFGGWGGEPNAYYLPTKFVVANPHLNIFKTYTVDDDCIIYKNDSIYRGLIPMFRRYATMLAENDISIRVADINARVLGIVEAKDDNTYNSAVEFFKHIEKGDNIPIASNALLDTLHTQPMGSESHANNLTDLIELQQYIKASWFNEIGLNANYNMKRESINSNEAQLNDDMLTPLIDDMLYCRSEQVEKINNMFGTNISVELGSAWKRNVIEWDNEIASESEHSEIEESGEVNTDDDTEQDG